jgi:hypothetical protein
LAGAGRERRGKIVGRAAKKGGRQLQRFRLGSAERFGWGCPAEYSTRAMVEFGGDDVELVLGERGQVGVLVQVLAQQPVDVRWYRAAMGLNDESGGC